MLSKLTPQAAARFAAMTDKVDEAQSRVYAVQRRIGDSERQMRGKSVETQAAEVAALQKDLDRQRMMSSEAQETFLALSRLHTNVRSWIAQLPPSVRLDDVEVELPETPGRESFIEAVTRIRCEIQDLKSERDTVRRAIPSIEELRAHSDAHVDALAARGRPTLPLDDNKISFGIDGSNQAAAFLVWLFADKVKERVRGEIEAQHERDTQNGVLMLSAATRAKRLASLEELILAQERDEETLIREAEPEGTIIPRREKASPLAVLGVQFVARSQTRAA